MSAKTKKRQEQHGNELLENPEALAGQISKTEEFVAHNKGIVIGGAIALALIVAGFFGYRYYKNTQEAEAQSSMFQAVYYFESDSLNLALNGDGNNLGLLGIIEDYSITDAANLANFYAGAIYLKQGKYDLAILYLKDYNANDLLVQPRAYSLIGDAYMELQDFENAASYYQKAADYKSNKYFTPRYLMKAALAYEKLNNTKAAIDAYTEVIEKYWDSEQYQEAQKFKARLSGATS